MVTAFAVDVATGAAVAVTAPVTAAAAAVCDLVADFGVAGAAVEFVFAVPRPVVDVAALAFVVRLPFDVESLAVEATVHVVAAVALVGAGAAAAGVGD